MITSLNYKNKIILKKTYRKYSYLCYPSLLVGLGGKKGESSEFIIHRKLCLTRIGGYTKRDIYIFFLYTTEPLFFLYISFGKFSNFI